MTFNVLHGLFCPKESDFCRAPDRVEILVRLIEQSGCAEVVGLQEIAGRQEELLPPVLEQACGGRYRVAWQAARSPDRTMVLTRLPILEQGYLDIANFPWEAYWVRVDSEAGPLDFLTAHFASGSNDPPCTAERCPPVCPAGIRTNECHAREVVELFARRPQPARLSVVAGDLNATPSEPTIAALTGAGFVDAWPAAGNPECDPSTERGCTGGGADPSGPLSGLDTVEGYRFGERIDYVLVRAGAGCTTRFLSVGAFAGEPLPEPVGGLYWSSDHVGVQADLDCA